MITMISSFERGSEVSQSAEICGMVVMAKKCARMAEHAMRKRTMTPFLNDSSMDLTKSLKVRPLLNKARIKTATVPMVPASVGVNSPDMIPPITMEKMTATAMNSGKARTFSRQVKATVDFGPSAGSILHHT